MDISRCKSNRNLHKVMQLNGGRAIGQPGIGSVSPTSLEEMGCISVMRDAIFIWLNWLGESRLFSLVMVRESQARLTSPFNGGLNSAQR